MISSEKFTRSLTAFIFIISQVAISATPSFGDKGALIDMGERGPIAVKKVDKDIQNLNFELSTTLTFLRNPLEIQINENSEQVIGHGPSRYVIANINVDPLRVDNLERPATNENRHIKIDMPTIIGNIADILPDSLGIPLSQFERPLRENSLSISTTRTDDAVLGPGQIGSISFSLERTNTLKPGVIINSQSIQVSFEGYDIDSQRLYQTFLANLDRQGIPGWRAQLQVLSMISHMTILNTSLSGITFELDGELRRLRFPSFELAIKIL